MLLKLDSDTIEAVLECSREVRAEVHETRRRSQALRAGAEVLIERRALAARLRTTGPDTRTPSAIS